MADSRSMSRDVVVGENNTARNRIMRNIQYLQPNRFYSLTSIVYKKMRTTNDDCVDFEAEKKKQ